MYISQLPCNVFHFGYTAYYVSRSLSHIHTHAAGSADLGGHDAANGSVGTSS